MLCFEFSPAMGPPGSMSIMDGLRTGNHSSGRWMLLEASPVPVYKTIVRVPLDHGPCSRNADWFQRACRLRTVPQHCTMPAAVSMLRCEGHPSGASGSSSHLSTLRTARSGTPDTWRYKSITDTEHPLR